MNAAGYDEERSHKNDEGNIVGQKHVDDSVSTHGKAEDGAERYGTAERPEHRNFAEIFVPEMRQEQWTERKGTAHVNQSELPSMPAAWAGTAVSAPSARIAADMRAEERSVTRYSNLFLVGRCGFAG